MKDARSDWREHCAEGGGAGSGQPAASSGSCQARQVTGHKTALGTKSGPPQVEGETFAIKGDGKGEGTGRLRSKRRGPSGEGSRARGKRHWGALCPNAFLVPRTVSMLHDIPERSEV